MSTDNGYNGWTNYETWCVNLWLDNDEFSHVCWSKRAEEILNGADGDKTEATPWLAGELKLGHDENFPDVQGVYNDMLTAAFDAVNWYEIASNMLDVVKEQAA